MTKKITTLIDTMRQHKTSTARVTVTGTLRHAVLTYNAVLNQQHFMAERGLVFDAMHSPMLPSATIADPVVTNSDNLPADLYEAISAVINERPVATRHDERRVRLTMARGLSNNPGEDSVILRWGITPDGSIWVPVDAKTASADASLFDVAVTAEVVAYMDPRPQYEGRVMLHLGALTILPFASSTDNT